MSEVLFMAINPLYNTTRLTGLSSGMDTDTLVQNMMQLEQLKLNRELRAQTKLEWKQQALGSVKDDLSAFRQTYMSVLSASNMLSGKVYNSFTIASSDRDNAFVTVSANEYASAGTYKLNHITQLARGARLTSGSRVSQSGEHELAANNTAQLKDLKFATPLVFEANPETGAREISFSINGEVFSFQETDTLSKVLSTVNGNAAAGVTIKYDRLTDSFTLETTKMGPDATLEVLNLRGNAFGAGGAFNIDPADLQAGQSAIVTINNVEVVRDTNAITIDGVTFKLNAAAEAGESFAPITISVTRDINATVDKVKAFVEGYNALVKKLNELIGEKVDRDYHPLTEEEKGSMTEKQVEQWETAAKAGLLSNDAGIRGLLSELRGALFESVAGAGRSPADIGISTGNYFLSGTGEIVLDEDRLRSALERDPDCVIKVFTDNSEATDPSVAFKEKGLLYRLVGAMENYTKGSQSVTLATLERSLADQQDRVTKMQEKMLVLEEKYYLKYAEMEKALAKLQSQSDGLSGLLQSVTS
ncbi:MAG: flagellar filament capping protein FliD [Clostridiales bacterium]|nr:flagellar filament capping protein FliD [Clostridiales bacterium]